jgi:hypothetical protein
MEFYVLGLCSSFAGYDIRIEEGIRGIKEAFGPDARAKVAWLDTTLAGEDADDEDVGFAREFVRVLRELAKRWQSKRK